MDVKKKIKIKNPNKNSKLSKNIEKKRITIQKSSKSKKFMYYPEFDDDKFYEKIYIKKEFHKNKIPKLDFSVDPKNKCSSKNFVLAPQQEFLKNFISIDTPYNGMLIYHGTGVGKTCSAVQIAEGFKNIMMRMHTDDRRKILVILGRRIIPNFKSNIYNIFKESNKTRPDDIVQCTGNTYSLNFDKYKSMTMSQKIKEINKTINNYYKFYGYEQFGNDVMRILGWDGKLNSLTDIQKKEIKHKFQNRIIIIDEIHNIKSDSSNIDLRKVPPILQAIIKYADNIRLVMMSATPMYDNASEIIFIINLLLENDGKKTIKKTDIFDKDDILIPGAQEKLYKLFKGYVSYVRGDNPITFPLKIIPKRCITPILNYDIKGNIIKPNEQMKSLKLFMCEMSEYQYKQYKLKLNSNTNKNSNNNNYNNNIKINNNEINKKNNRLNIENVSYTKLQPLFYISNIILPNKNGDNIRASKEGHAYQKYDNGEGAFIIQEKLIPKNKKKYYQFKYQDHLIFNKNTKNESCFLDEENLQKYSTKFYNALRNIKYGKGICYVYSEFVWGGVLPFALMLEQNGFDRYTIDSEKSLLEYPVNKFSKGGKKNPVCAICSKYANDPIHTCSKNKNHHNFKIARYILVTGDINISRIETSQLMQIVNSDNNKYGEEVKVIIGTKTTGEGLDFKRIRQVHILEPWYNLSRIDQIIGRAARNCSHVDLPKNERNVEVILYATKPPQTASKKEKETETIDSRFYRKAEVKDIKIKEVEYIIKRCAVDCSLNKNANIHNFKYNINMITSTGEKVLSSLSDKPYSRECNYKKDCEYKCIWEPNSKKKYTINTDTYTERFARSDIISAKRIIKNMYKFGYAYDLNDIITNVNNNLSSLENKLIYQAIAELIDNINEPVYDQYDRIGYIIYRGIYYIYQPVEFNYLEAPLYYRRIPINEKPISYLLGNDENNNNIANINNSKKLTGKEILSNIFIELEKNMKEISYNDKNKSLIIIGMLVDRLSNKNKILILKYLIQTYYNNDCKFKEPYICDIILFFDSNLIYNNRDIHFNKKSSKKDKIKGFYIDKKYFCYYPETKSISECSTDIKNKLVISKKIKNSNKNKNIKFNTIYGFMEEWKNGDFVFKIFDGTRETGALTLNMKKSKRSEIKGKRCETFKSKELQAIIKNLNIKVNSKNIKNICRDIEYILRKLEIDNFNNKKWIKNSLE